MNRNDSAKIHPHARSSQVLKLRTEDYGTKPDVK